MNKTDRVPWRNAVVPLFGQSGTLGVAWSRERWRLHMKEKGYAIASVVQTHTGTPCYGPHGRGGLLRHTLRSTGTADATKSRRRARLRNAGDLSLFHGRLLDAKGGPLMTFTRSGTQWGARPPLFCIPRRF